MSALDFIRHRSEFLRHVANKHYEAMPDGRILLSKANAILGGGILHDVNGRDQRFDDNLLPTLGLNLLLDVMFHGATAVSTWYVSPFVANVAPTSALTYANYIATLTELTAYDETTRPAYVEAAASGGVTTNSASKATFTINGTVNNWGMALLSVSTKSDAGAGYLAAAVKYAAVRALQAGDILSGQYSVTATSS